MIMQYIIRTHSVINKAILLSICLNVAFAAAPPRDVRATTGICQSLCPQDYHPVCGNDGRTYTNDCIMRSESCQRGTFVTKDHDGPCSTTSSRAAPCDPNCPSSNAQVCGNNGKTYQNECLMRLEGCQAGMNVLKSHDGPCTGGFMGQGNSPGSSSSTSFFNGGMMDNSLCNTSSCPQNFQPVCGSDGKTYMNECTMRAEGCIQKKTIVKDRDGVCRSNVNNSGMMGMNNNHPGGNCDTNCPTTYQPVCGNDGRTYTNDCSMRAESCRMGTFVTKDYEGSCRGGSSSFNSMGQGGIGQFQNCDSIHCPSQSYQPVCGNDGRTYSNECAMRLESCQRRLNVVKAYEGTCHGSVAGGSNFGMTGNCDPTGCPQNFQPVCGNDGKTYMNECTMSAESCQYKTNVMKMHDGICRPNSVPSGSFSSSGMSNGRCDTTSCPQNFFTVCGNDGKTYANDCIMRAASCQTGMSIFKNHDGDCRRPGLPPCEINCPNNWAPVCGTDRTTYGNVCQLRSRNCQLQQLVMATQQAGGLGGTALMMPMIQQPQPIINLAHDGPC